ncbi:MAG: ribonuclease III domain-containing protein [Lachnospira sp.]|jgi:ribonuclease-3 family protein|nr:ribonuclease III domain-containing protein [Lachnospira sp.]
MEESISKWDENLTNAMWEHLQLGDIDPKTMSPLVLAYIGDSVYDLAIRTFVISKGNMQVNKLNKHACGLVKAEMQSKMIGFIEPLLEPNEEAVYKRGRNAKSYTSAKNASITDYRRATGFEALMGYLYLSGRYNRMMELVTEGLKQVGEIKLS